MVDLKEILDFKDQHLVDELYKRLKETEEYEHLEEVYVDITHKNKTKMQMFQYQYAKIIQRVWDVLNIIGWIFFACLFIICGAFISATFVSSILTTSHVFDGIYQFCFDLGVSLQKTVFPALSNLFNYTEQSTSFLFCVLGLTILLILFYTSLYIWSLFKKNDTKKKKRELSLKDSYHYLNCCEDDTWLYIKSSFEKRIHKRHRKDFFEFYYQAYLLIAKHHEDMKGIIKDLTKHEQMILCLRTCTNTIKNILGSMAMPMYISFALLIFYQQNFNAVSNLKLKTVLEMIPFGNIFYSCLDICYHIMSYFPVSKYFAAIDLELAMVISFCICMIVVWSLYTILKTRLQEIKRQYLRRIQFYLKQHQGIYKPKQKYPSEYLYGVQFTFFLFFVGIMIGISQFFIASLPYPLEDIRIIMEHRQNVLRQIQPYVEKENHILGNWDEYFSDTYAIIDSLTDIQVIGTHNRPYLKIYTYYTQEDAKKAFMSEQNQYTHHGKDHEVQYVYSSKGFMILDHTSLMKMKNDQDLIGKRLSQKEIKALMKQMGYVVNE